MPAFYSDEDFARLQAAGRDHLWLHFSRHSVYEQGEMPVIVRGEGAYLYDAKGKRYLDGLAGLFVNQLGHGRADIAEAAAKQAAQLAFMPLWSYAHPKAMELAERVASHAPGDLNRIFFTSGGGEAVESAWKLAKNYFKLTGKPTKHKVISRTIAYHGTPQGALSITGIPMMKAQFEPLVPSTFRVPNTNFYRAPDRFQTGGAAERADNWEAFGRWAADEIAVAIENEGADTVAAVFLEPVQNSGAASRRPPATSSGSARSATSTTCCWSPTRSSAPSAASVTGSEPGATATSPTSSPAPRASPAATPRWAR